MEQMQQHSVHLNGRVCYTIQDCATAATSCNTGATVEKVNNQLYLWLMRGWNDEGGGGGGGGGSVSTAGY